METLAKGQRLPLANLVPDGVLQIVVAAQGLALDVACFGLDAAGKLSDELLHDLFNHAAHACGGVEARRGRWRRHGRVCLAAWARLPAVAVIKSMTASAWAKSSLPLRKARRVNSPGPAGWTPRPNNRSRMAWRTAVPPWQVIS